MHALEIALLCLAVAFWLVLLAIARRNERRRRGYSIHRAHGDDRDTLGKFRRIIGR